jgi:hypothetical protein
MDLEVFIDTVASRAGIEDPAAMRARACVEAVLAALTEQLVPDEASALAHALPEPLARVVRDTVGAGAQGAEVLYRSVAEREQAPLGFAMEHAQIVLQVLAEQLPLPTRVRLERHLDPDVAALFAPRPPTPAPPAHVHHEPTLAPGEGTTLATGRPGSRHPLSEARPPLAHAHSVARSDDPHADTRLSSSSGLTQERLHETLAEGHPGSKKPLAEGKG